MKHHGKAPDLHHLPIPEHAPVQRPVELPKPPALAASTVRPRFEFASEHGPEPDETGKDKTHALGALRATREGWDAMRASHPDFYVGMTVFGSMVKGRARRGSDVDGVIFYDPASEYAGSLDLPIMFAQPREDVAVHIKSRLQQAGYSDAVQGKDSFMIMKMNNGVIDRAVEGLEKVISSSPGGRINVPIEIRTLFYMRVGTGNLQAYRSRLLNSLATKEGGEAIWQQLAESVVKTEELNRKADIYFPKTLEEACSYFGIAYEPKTHAPEPESHPHHQGMRRLRPGIVAVARHPHIRLGHAKHSDA